MLSPEPRPAAGEDTTENELAGDPEAPTAPAGPPRRTSSRRTGGRAPAGRDGL
jgi:hypothetical protein